LALATRVLLAEQDGLNRMTALRNFLNDEQGQDLIEYTLFLAFVCIASAALFTSAGNSLGG